MTSAQSALRTALSGDVPPAELRQQIRNDQGSEMRHRRDVLTVSLVGIASMAIVSLYQMGKVRHLPDPPVSKPHFDSDKVNATEEAFGYGMPDGPLTLLAHAMNVALAAAGPPDRARTRPWLPLLAAAVSAPQAAIAAKYLFHQMPKVDKAWCPYCVVDALTHFATFALVAPEAVEAARHLTGTSQTRH
ncbi:vitamin K epoxide reductase family protein [Lysobacter korlensis]|uniref:Vitamin K epoxide reductase family protein n=1 Tax=Lysobacter korlensis TaxID=553636 RepID=A0ABV6RLW6_9GAMM